MLQYRSNKEERTLESKDVSSTSSEEPSPRTPKAIVCVYAQTDEPFYNLLKEHLMLWQHQEWIVWREITPGMDTAQTMQTFLHEADLILLLMSSSFLANTTCHAGMGQALREYQQRNVPVVPVLARASAWKESDCGGLKALPDDEQ